MLNWIGWDERVLTFKLPTWDRNAVDNKTVYLYKNELFEIGLFIYKKMDLALVNL